VKAKKLIDCPTCPLYGPPGLTITGAAPAMVAVVVVGPTLWPVVGLVADTVTV